MGAVKPFLRHHDRHFDAAALTDGAEGSCQHLAGGGKVLRSLGGAMRTAEMGPTIAELLRRDKLHALCMTGANLEEELSTSWPTTATSACPSTAPPPPAPTSKPCTGAAGTA